MFAAPVVVEAGSGFFVTGSVTGWSNDVKPFGKFMQFT